MQNNPPFVQKKQNCCFKKKHHRLTLFRSFSIYKRPWAVMLFSMFLHSQYGSLCSVWYPSMHCLQHILDFSFPPFFWCRHLRASHLFTRSFRGWVHGGLQQGTVAYCSRSSPVQHVVYVRVTQFLQITWNYMVKLSSNSVKGGEPEGSFNWMSMGSSEL